MADHLNSAHTRDLEGGYQVRCPDVVEITIPGYPELSGPRRIGAEGRVFFPDGNSLIVDGLTPPQIARRVGGYVHLSAQQIRVRVVDYRSQEVFLLSPGSELQQAVAYHGPETVVDFLQRLGGLPPRAETDEIRIIRPHVADGKPPEIFTVNLRAILVDHEQQTNIRLEPSDQIHIGVSSEFPFSTLFPPGKAPTSTSSTPTPPGGKQARAGSLS
jgi:protein involved in polysaccharide export with SLBB domain